MEQPFTDIQIAVALLLVAEKLIEDTPWPEDDWQEVEGRDVDVNFWSTPGTIGATLYPVLERDGVRFTDTSRWVQLAEFSTAGRHTVHKRYMCANRLMLGGTVDV